MNHIATSDAPCREPPKTVLMGQDQRRLVSDRGSQHASHVIRKQLAAFKMKASMSRKGDCWDNAVTETLFGSLKVERLHGMCFATRRQAKDEVMDWMAFYTHRRLHSTLGYTSPMAFE
jgi:putative transposase